MSNRLPTSLRMAGGRLRSFPSAGGLASALAGFQAGENFVWIGWPGDVIPRDRRGEVEELLAAQNLYPVFLTATQEEHYYRATCNQVLWPLFHYFADRLTFDERSWQVYVEVNRRFADAVLAHADDHSRVWVHDFHLMLVPSMLREARPDLEIGFFLHIPFPSAEIYRQLPTRGELLEGVLGADYIGFHTADYARHFRSSCLRVLGLESEPNSIIYESRPVTFGTSPIGVDVAGFRETLADPETAALHAELHKRYGERRLILGVERLDYTKGIPLKLQAFERYLARAPERAREVTLLQVLVPSRLNHPEYRELKSEIDEYIGRINGTYGSPGNTPIEYMHRHVDPAQLVALYRYADVGLVTPVRDGMNLIAQEFVLCQEEGPCPDPHKGILVLSEFAGAAHYLSRAILTNPWNIEQTASAIVTALGMSDDEKRERSQAMIERVVDMDCRIWARRFLSTQTAAAHRRAASPTSHRVGEAEQARILTGLTRAPRRLLALDYDGTLTPIVLRPEDAEPSQEIVDLLRALAELDDTEVHLVSGRKQKTMQEWFGALPIHLCAEHGFKARPVGGEWTELLRVDLTWMPMVEGLLRRASEEVPGTIVERKTCALAWHYRMADLDYGVWRARELLSALENDLSNLPVEVVSGHRVIEVRAAGVNKGAYLNEVLAGQPEDTFVLCAGDDRTDLDMYRVLPQNAVSIHVGAGVSETRYSIESPARLRAFLRRVAAISPEPAARTTGGAGRRS